MRRISLALLATATLALAACSTDSGDKPTEQPAPAKPVTTTPAATSATPTPSTEPTLTRWVNVVCSPEGATARTTSGGKLVCKRVGGKESQPQWHAATP